MEAASHGIQEELLGRKTEQTINPEDLPDAMDRVRRRLAGETGILDEK